MKKVGRKEEEEKKKEPLAFYSGEFTWIKSKNRKKIEIGCM